MTNANTGNSDTRVPRAGYRLRYVAKSAIVSVVVLYLAFSAEFEAVRAVYEAY